MNKPKFVRFIAEYYSKIGELHRASKTKLHEEWMDFLMLGTEFEVTYLDYGWKSKQFKVSRIDPPNVVIKDTMLVYLEEI